MTVQAQAAVTLALIEHTRLTSDGRCSCGHTVPLGKSFIEHQAEAIIDQVLLAMVHVPRAVTDAEVEVAARAMFEEPGAVSPYAPDYVEWAEVAATDQTRAAIWREDARRVLEAVEAARKVGGE